MPIPVPAWTQTGFPTAKYLNLATATSDGTADHPTGTVFLAARPILYEAYTAAGPFTTSPAGTQSVMSTSGTTTSSIMAYDAAGLFGKTSDLPGYGYYQHTAAVPGSAGDGVTPGGWMILAHFAAVAAGSTQTALEAGWLPTGGSLVPGSRQLPSGVNSSAAFAVDLVNVGTVAWQPALTIADSASANATTVVNVTDPSGHTSRMYAVWAAVSATTSGLAQFTSGGTSSWVAPAGVTEVTVSAFAAGSGGGAGNVSGGGEEFGGGGGAGGEFASGTVTVTPGNVYTVNVGSAGQPGAQPGGIGGAGGNSSFSGDTTTITANGPAGGAGATTTGDGAGATGASGSTAPTHYNGGSGDSGTTATTGGGGGSSAGTSTAGNNATDGRGAPAPPGGGPGGDGGTADITVLQTAKASNNGSHTITAHFPSMVQAGSTIIACVLYQAKNITTDPTVQLNDGTNLTSQTSVTDSLPISYELGVYNAFAVSGGQSSVTVTGYHGSGVQSQVLDVQVYEVAGLGASPTVDNSNTGTGTSGSSYSRSTTTTGAPDFWLGLAGAQQTSNFSIYPPSSSWTSLGTTKNGSKATLGGTSYTVYAGILSAYQVATAPGTLSFSGKFSRTVDISTIVVAYTSSAATPGVAPVTGPGGGGGGGLGANDGAAGMDGQVTLTWTGQSGSGYGTPALPQPWPNWSPVTTLGAGPGFDVDINGPTGITDVVNFLTHPPAFRIQDTAAPSIPSGALTLLAFTGDSPTVDSYAGWDAGTYTVQRDGIYLFGALGCFAANTTGIRMAGAAVNGTTYWGPPYAAAAAGGTNATKTQVLSLRAGDTVALALYQDSGAPLTLSSTAASRFFLAWLCAPGVPQGNWTPPDVTFRWAAGTQGENLGGDLTAVWQQHVASDLGFLVNRPYLLAWQSIAQTGLAAGAFSPVTLDMPSGIIHGDTGDPWSGWTAGAANLYTAPVDGWYALIGEAFTAGTSASGATVTAGITQPASGGYAPSASPDWYQELTATTSGGGASLFGVTYALQGETIQPQVMGTSYPAPYSTLTGSLNGGVMASHLSVVWISN